MAFLDAAGQIKANCMFKPNSLIPQIPIFAPQIKNPILHVAKIQAHSAQTFR
jgi:hypothetical protein